MKEEDRLAKIREFVDLQAEDEWLWSFPVNRKETIQEAYIKRALRKLHMIIESDNQTLVEQIFEVYKKFLEEQK